MWLERILYATTAYVAGLTTAYKYLRGQEPGHTSTPKATATRWPAPAGRSTTGAALGGDLLALLQEPAPDVGGSWSPMTREEGLIELGYPTWGSAPSAELPPTGSPESAQEWATCLMTLAVQLEQEGFCRAAARVTMASVGLREWAEGQTDNA